MECWLLLAIRIDIWEATFSTIGFLYLAPGFVSSQGFGNLFNPVSSKENTILISLPCRNLFACNYGTNKHIYTIDAEGNFIYGVPSPDCNLSFRHRSKLAMINLTIVAKALLMMNCLKSFMSLVRSLNWLRWNQPNPGFKRAGTRGFAWIVRIRI